MPEGPPSRVVAAVLAAGAGRRMGAPKGELVVAGVRLVDRAVRVALDAGCAAVVAVVRAGVAVPDAEVVVNPDPERGLRSSLELAIDAAERHRADAVVALLADMPGVGAGDLRSVLAAWRPGRVTLARYGDRSGHPVVMAPATWRRALASAGADEGARWFLSAHPELVDEVPVSGDPVDLDRPDDLDRWGSR